MRLSRLFFTFIIVAGLVAAGSLGCAKKQLKADGGRIEPVEPQTTAQKAPSEGNEGQASRNTKEIEAPPGPKEQPEPVEAAKNERALNDIHFDLDRYDIKAGDEKVLGEDYKFIKDNGASLVLVEGNCDERGTVEYNLALGERRAEAAKKYLVSLGVSPSRLKTISYGKSKPVDPGHDEAAWAKNRRDHFVVE